MWHVFTKGTLSRFYQVEDMVSFPPTSLRVALYWPPSDLRDLFLRTGHKLVLNSNIRDPPPQNESFVTWASFQLQTKLKRGVERSHQPFTVHNIPSNGQICMIKIKISTAFHRRYQNLKIWEGWHATHFVVEGQILCDSCGDSKVTNKPPSHAKHCTRYCFPPSKSCNDRSRHCLGGQQGRWWQK